MKTPEPAPLQVHIAAAPIYSDLAGQGSRKAHLLSFCIPDYGALFRCRVVTDPKTALVASALSALRFIEKSLDTSKELSLEICTDSPAFFFALQKSQQRFQVTETTRPGNSSSTRTAREALEEYGRKFRLSSRLIDPAVNKAKMNSDSLPTSPEDVKTPLKVTPEKFPSKGKMLPLQDGIDL